MIDFLSAFTEDMRRFALAMAIAGVAADVGPTARILSLFGAAILLIFAYVIIEARRG